MQWNSINIKVGMCILMKEFGITFKIFELLSLDHLKSLKHIKINFDFKNGVN